MSKTLLDGGSTTTSGGTNQVFEESGEKLANGVVLVDSGEANYFSRSKINMTSRVPSVQSNGLYSNAKRSATYVMPMTLADGVTTVYNSVRIEVSIHPESAASDLAELREKGAQILVDAEFDNFYTYGSLQ